VTTSQRSFPLLRVRGGKEFTAAWKDQLRSSPQRLLPGGVPHRGNTSGADEFPKALLWSDPSSYIL
jgi:hypothetical protein